MNLEMAGTSGVIDYDSAKDSPLLFKTRSSAATVPGVVVPESPLERSPYYRELEHFMSCIRDGASRSSRQKTHTKRFVSRLPPLPPWPPASRWLSRMMRSHSPQHEKKAIDVFSKSDRMRGSFFLRDKKDTTLLVILSHLCRRRESYEIGSNQLCAYARVQLCQSAQGSKA